MYGLMRARSCGQHAEERRRHRLHYCGACKTMGRMYGQRARLLLNNDGVFLGELLTALSAAVPPVDEWDRSYQSYNCFARPESDDQMPLSLQIAASATVVMSEFKVRDQIEDGGGRGWKLALRVYSEAFSDASKRLAGWGFPVGAMWKAGREQEGREHEVSIRRSERSAAEWLEYLAEPTSAVTAMVFEYGARAVGGPDAVEMHRLGRAFGRLVYLLDALEDFDKDVRRAEFNAVRAAFAIEGPDLPLSHRNAAETLVRQAVADADGALAVLPIDDGLKRRLALRLRLNVDGKIGDQVTVEAQACGTARTPPGIRARWSSAVSLARRLTERERAASPKSIGRAAAAPFVFVSVLLLALLAPRFALAATSYRECMELSLNLMALGGIAAAGLAAPARLARPLLAFASGGGGSANVTLLSPAIQPGRPTSSVVRRRRPRPTCADSCNCGSMNCWDCLCCCQGMECCCDGIQCCECCTAAGDCGACCG